MLVSLLTYSPLYEIISLSIELLCPLVLDNAISRIGYENPRKTSILQERGLVG